MNKFKTMVTPNLEFGILDTDMFDAVCIGTSTSPNLYNITTQLKDLKPIYENYPLYGEDRKFDWDKDFPKDWTLVTCTITIDE